MRLDSRSYQLAKASIENIFGRSPSTVRQPIARFIVTSAAVDDGSDNIADDDLAYAAPFRKPNSPVPATSSSNSRMSLKDFLRTKASTGDGVEFHDGDPDLVRIPWIHASKKNWKGSQHGRIFIEWAKNTGKPTDDVKKCKANFRCALNSLRDVQEEPQLSKKNGNDGYRVFRISAERSRSSKNSRASKARKATLESSPKPNTTLFESPPVSPDDVYSEAMPDFSLFPCDYGIECDFLESVEEPKTCDPYKIPLPVANMEVDDDDVEGKQKKSRSRGRRS